MHKILIAICSCTAILMVSNNNISYCMEQLDKKEQHIKLIDELALIKTNIQHNISELVNYKSKIIGNVRLYSFIDQFIVKMKSCYDIIFPQGSLGTGYIAKVKHVSDIYDDAIQAFKDMNYDDKIALSLMLNIRNSFDALIKN